MNPSDLIVLCALDLSMSQCRDLLCWYCRPDPWVIHDPSLQWWCRNYGKQVADYLAKEYWRTH